MFEQLSASFLSCS